MSKNRPKFIMLGGLPASGKSTYARQIETPCNIVSSDSVREQLYGDESVQGNSTDVFEVVHDRIIQHLSKNENVVLDATNLSRKYRNHLISKLQKFDVEKQYVLLATHPDTCKERNATRNRTVPNYVYDNMIRSFNVPLKSEGWDYIDIIYGHVPSIYTIEQYKERINGYNQENPHHRQDLLGHVMAVRNKAVAEMPAEPVIEYAALLHDCAKPLTKVFNTIKGVPTEHAHYYGHDNYGAWESLFYMANHLTSTRQILDVATLVEFHMRPYFAKTEKAKNKIKNLLGEDLYYMLEILHKADVESH